MEMNEIVIANERNLLLYKIANMQTKNNVEINKKLRLLNPLIFCEFELGHVAVAAVERGKY